MVRAGFIWLRIRTGVGCCVNGNETYGLHAMLGISLSTLNSVDLITRLVNRLFNLCHASVFLWSSGNASHSNYGRNPVRVPTRRSVFLRAFRDFTAVPPDKWPNIVFLWLTSLVHIPELAGSNLSTKISFSEIRLFMVFLSPFRMRWQQ
jgi:hypothetical protein